MERRSLHQARKRWSLSVNLVSSTGDSGSFVLFCADSLPGLFDSSFLTHHNFAFGCLAPGLASFTTDNGNVS